MTLNPIAPNQTEITLPNGDMVFFSYRTPVAALIGPDAFRTEKKWSTTTSRHINAWLAGREAQKRPQSFFDALPIA